MNVSSEGQRQLCMWCNWVCFSFLDSPGNDKETCHLNEWMVNDMSMFTQAMLEESNGRSPVHEPCLYYIGSLLLCSTLLRI